MVLYGGHNFQMVLHSGQSNGNIRWPMFKWYYTVATSIKWYYTVATFNQIVLCGGHSKPNEWLGCQGMQSHMNPFSVGLVASDCNPTWTQHWFGWGMGVGVFLFVIIPWHPNWPKRSSCLNIDITKNPNTHAPTEPMLGVHVGLQSLATKPTNKEVHVWLQSLATKPTEKGFMCDCIPWQHKLCSVYCDVATA